MTLTVNKEDLLYNLVELNMNFMKVLFSIIGLAGITAFLISLPVSYVTHIVWWIKLAMNGQLDTAGEFMLAAFGTFIPIIGIIHGYILWF